MIFFVIILDVSQPSLGTENEPIERLTTPPLSPMCSSDGQSVQVSLSSKGKTQVMYAKPSSTASMETHWEEAIRCSHPEKKSERNKKITEISIDADDTESELIVIPESDMSDSTLHGSVQDSFEETMDDSCCSFQTKGDKVCAVVKIQEPFETAIKTPKDVYLSQIIKTPTTKRPTWIIGSEDESLKSWENKNYSMHETSVYSNTQRNLIELQKYCSKITSIEATSLVNTVSVVTGVPNVQMAKTVTTDSHKPITHNTNDNQHTSKLMPLGKHKKIIEPIMAPACTPVSECEDCYRNNQYQNQEHNQNQYQCPNQNQIILPAPSIERLLPIGAARSPGIYFLHIYNNSIINICIIRKFYGFLPSFGIRRYAQSYMRLCQQSVQAAQ